LAATSQRQLGRRTARRLWAPAPETTFKNRQYRTSLTVKDNGQQGDF
jgi:hypothetical protein